MFSKVENPSKVKMCNPINSLIIAKIN
uniref:Uncharacterized protein n=1 Tax=Rhizophora mucronata TaxID=61149 RepID=A0A2P2NYN9_RHIMU